MSDTSCADVVIVGGGLMGCAAAFFLRRRGRSVILLERDLVGQHASGVNFGNVRRQGRSLNQLELANRSRALWARLPALIGEDLEFLPSGHLRVCYRYEEVDALEAYANAPEAREIGLEVLTGSALRRRFPYLGEAVAGGTYAPFDGHANPRLAAPAFARAAKRQGVSIHERTEVAHVEKCGDFRVTTVDGRQFRAPSLLITAGAWGDRLAAQFGEAVPLTQQAPQMAVTEPVPYGLPTVLGVYTQVVEEGIYLRQIPRGNVIIGGGHRATPDMQRNLAHVDPRNTLNQLAQLRRLIPALGRLHIIRTWSGIEGYLPDAQPILGPSRRVDGLFYAFGFSGAGFQLGPGVGEVLAELITTGSTTTDLSSFSIGRFVSETVPFEDVAARPEE